MRLFVLSTTIACFFNWSLISLQADDGPIITPALKVPPSELLQTKSTAKQSAIEQVAFQEAEAEVEEFDEMTYWKIYRSIPFRRAEYDANPSYRHDATMEILTGKPRNVIIHKVQPQPAPKTRTVRVAVPAYPVYDWSRGPYSRYQRLFGYTGGYRGIYYRNGGYLLR